MTQSFLQCFTKFRNFPTKEPNKLHSFWRTKPSSRRRRHEYQSVVCTSSRIYLVRIAAVNVIVFACSRKESWSTMRRGSESIVSGYQFDPVGIEWPAGFLLLTLWTRAQVDWEVGFNLVEGFFWSVVNVARFIWCELKNETYTKFQSTKKFLLVYKCSLW